MNEEAELLPGTLDLLILKAVSLGPLHGYPFFPGSSRFPVSGCSSSREHCIRLVPAGAPGIA